MPSSVDLVGYLENFIPDPMKSRRYNSSSEAIREGGHLLQEREPRFAALAGWQR